MVVRVLTQWTCGLGSALPFVFYRVVTLKTTFLANVFILNLDVEMAGSLSLISLNSFFMLFLILVPLSTYPLFFGWGKCYN